MKRLLLSSLILVSAKAQADNIKVYNNTDKVVHAAFYYDDGSSVANKDIGSGVMIGPKGTPSSSYISNPETMVRPERKGKGIWYWDRNIYFTHNQDELKDPILSDSLLRTKGQFFNVGSAKGPFYINQRADGSLFATTKK